MRILHTSDWHLGRSFHGVGLADAQRAFIDFLVDTITREHVDVVIVAGDVYDRALPPPDMVDLLDDALGRITGAGATAIVTSGNHDSARRLGFAGRLIENSGVSLRTRLADIERPLIVSDEDGPVAFYGIPYLEPALTWELLDADERSHHAVLTAALDRIRADLSDRPDVGRSIVIAHAFVTGGEPSDSERDIGVGGVCSVSSALFDGFDYAALGHLHGRQRISETVRYSGSPLPYSFSEAAQGKGGWLIDLDAGGVAAVAAVDAPEYRRLAVLTGELADLLESDSYAWAEDAFVSVTLTDTTRTHGALERLRERFPHIVQLAFAERVDSGRTVSYAKRLAAATTDVDVCAGFIAHVSGEEATEQELDELRTAVEEARTADADL
ncbi:exonuclease SbcCD subunit D [Spelaeicoccus albus]|uniref:Nuclease SbcCD subunit D n=1 Tax=Spelaeicoccus albus TaxID=1280376 RepID=A0A7Z0D3V4_9MICO|nr:exonuclease SbcCD subunit D [Spelaeicoccus albus]NYI68363.1 exonuclease SbcD [Spelaeicoccus albus]